MASSSSLGSSIPAPAEAVQVLVSSLADESPIVREASMASLKDISPLNPLLVLDCCSAISRGGRRRFGNMAGVFQVMAFGVRALDKNDIDASYIAKLAKIVTAEIISSKMMEEIFLHLSGPSSGLPAMVQILADFASADALQFTPRLKGVLSRVLPIIGNGRDAHRPIFANAFKCWCQAVWQYNIDFPSESPIDGDVISKVRVSSVEALGQMVGLITRSHLKAALPRLVPTILELYRKDQDIELIATYSLYNLLNASLLPETGPPLLDFEELSVILSTLLPVICMNSDSKECSNFSVALKTYNEVQRCFLSVGSVYPEDLFSFLLNKCRLKEEPLTFGALCVLKHLLPRSSEAWHNKRHLLVDTVKLLLDEQNLDIRKALSEVKTRSTCPKELRAICEKGLLLVTITIPEMEHILWPFLLKMIIPRAYTGAVAIVCRCIAELCRHRSSYNHNILGDYKARDDIPSPEELFARLVVLLHNPLAREQRATHILKVLSYLAPLFPRNINLFWQDEIQKMKAYISDPEDLKLDPSYQETWDEMIINFLTESLDVIHDNDWMLSLGNAFTKQYALYTPDDEHSAVLHRPSILGVKILVRCLGMLLQKVNDRAYVRGKIDWMYKQANIAIPINRLGLAKSMGLVAASHLDTVLDKLKDILDNVGQSIFQRFLAFFSESYRTEESDDVHAALALMYGYAARYAPSVVIEARIDALVGTNMLSRLLHVRHPKAKQAVITAIDLLGRAVAKAAENGAPFPLKRRDMLLDYILTLMGREETDGFADSSLELLRTQALALNACTTLVSVEPKLTIETRNHVMKATLGFFALPNDPIDVVNPLIDNLITLLCAILLTSGEDGRSRAEQLLHILRKIDQYVSSSVDYQRRRGCLAVYEMLDKFRVLCICGYCPLGCHGGCTHGKQIDRTHGNFSNLPSAFVLPSREALSLGDRVITYLPRCADADSEIRKISAQILDQLFNISLSLPKPLGSSVYGDIELCYVALSSLEDVIAILRSDASIDPSEVFNRIVASVCTLMTKEELVGTLHCCMPAICDRIKQSAEGAILAVIEFVAKRGSELSESDVSRDIVTKDISRLRGGWPMQDAFHAFSQHTVLSVLFLEHLISVLNQTRVTKSSDPGKGENSSLVSETQLEDEILQASIFALTSFFRGGGKVGKRAVEHSYSSVLAALVLQLGSCHGLATSGRHEPLRALLTAFKAFCECVGDLETGKILARDSEHNEKWINLIGDLADCISMKRPKEVQNICKIFSKSLNLQENFQREAAAAAVSEFIQYGSGFSSLLEEMVEVLCRHVSDESPTVRCLCLRGLVKIPSAHIDQYTTQVLGVILALLDDLDESVQLTAVSCLLMISMNVKMRADAFAAFGALSNYGIQAHKDAFLEQIHATLPRLILHLHDDELSIRLTCRNTLKRFAPLMEIEGLLVLFNSHIVNSDHRSDYEDFVRDFTKQFLQHLPSRVDTYMVSTIQAFDAPWPIIQANAIYVSSSILSLSDDRHILTLYYSQVFGMLVSKMSRSTDAIVRATSSSAFGLLLKSTNSVPWKAARLERLDVTTKGQPDLNEQTLPERVTILTPQDNKDSTST
ncbi:hypothetical protein GOBAR_AA05489 [Gossypium barbadense]|uniref:Condensin complex subunit 1 C-terminal domain-containing protein n=1 Tax=Gossypium barbadense TaxID=3634 RepID=A0A2P5YHK2_GOSBA|nr:hypothetical protein GOBAR_AA05489 [Gossypium barbadense]